MTQNGETLRLVALGFDAVDPVALARWWAAALGWEVGDETGASVALVPTDATRFTVVFRPTTAAKGAAQNRIHLDLTTTSLDDQNESVERLIHLGGRHIDIGQRDDEEHVVLADPEGNELCIIEPTNNFLAGCGRFGSITCDGTREVGYFWSAALGWPLVWDQDEETAIRDAAGDGPLITWGGPPVAPKHGRNRLHLELAPPEHREVRAEIDRLVALGAVRLGEIDGEGGGDWVDMIDPDGNEFRILTSR